MEPTLPPQPPQPGSNMGIPLQPQFTSSVPQQPVPPPPVPGHDHKRLTIIVTVAVVIIVGGLLAYVLVFASKNKSNNSGVTNLPFANQAAADDTTRKTDINALQGQTEAYEAENGFYPTLANINDSTWRAANMKGLDPSALQDPQGTTDTLAATPAKGVYSYDATPGGCDNSTTDNDCTGYTLTATLEEGGTYTKENLN